MTRAASSLTLLDTTVGLSHGALPPSRSRFSLLLRRTSSGCSTRGRRPSRTTDRFPPGRSAALRSPRWFGIGRVEEGAAGRRRTYWARSNWGRRPRRNADTGRGCTPHRTDSPRRTGSRDPGERRRSVGSIPVRRPRKNAGTPPARTPPPRHIRRRTGNPPALAGRVGRCWARSTRARRPNRRTSTGQGCRSRRRCNRRRPDNLRRLRRLFRPERCRPSPRRARRRRTQPRSMQTTRKR